MTITPAEARAMRDAAARMGNTEATRIAASEAFKALLRAAPTLATLYADTADELARVTAERDALRAELEAIRAGASSACQ